MHSAHSLPYQRGMHQVHRFTPPKLFNFFRGLVENFPQFPSISESFYPPAQKLFYLSSPNLTCTMHIHSPTSEACTKCTALPPQKLFNFFRGSVENLHNFLQFPNLSTPLTQKILYLSSPNLTCTVRIHSPTQRGMHQVHRFTPPKLFNFFRGSVENFTQFPSISESFYPPHTKNILPIVSKFDMHSAHSLPYAARHAPSAPLYPPRNYSTFFAARSKISHNFLQFPNLSTPLAQKIFYLSSPNLTCTMHIHSPTQRGMHQVHRFTPPEIIQLFSRLGRKFHTISFNFRIFLPPSHKKYSPYRLQLHDLLLTRTHVPH